MEEPGRSAPQLQRCLGLRESITITVGTVIGVGLFTVGANTVGVLGPSVLFATLAALAVSIYPALLYAEMGAALPYAGGTYQYAALGMGRPFGVLAGWSFVISMVSVAGGEALAFGFYFRTLFDALGVALPLGERALACLVLAAFLLFSLFGVRLGGRLQNGFMFFFWGVAAVWVLSVAGRFRFPHFSQLTPQGGAAGLAGFPGAVAMVWWCFAGFETCCAMGEEVRFPQQNLPRALFLAPFLVFAVNALFQWVLLCIVPPAALGQLAAAAAPYAEGMRLAGVTGFPLVLLCLGITLGGDCSTLNAGVSAPARYLFTMARDGVLPGVFARLHPRYRTPWAAILALGGLMLLLVGSGSIVYIASLSLFATLFYYIIGIASAWNLRRTHPELERPYRAPKIQIGAPVSILLYLLMMTQLDRAALLSGAVWCLLGMIIYCLWGRGGAAPAVFAPPQGPNASEQRALDREYRRWRAATAAAVAAVLLLYLLAFLLARP